MSQAIIKASDTYHPDYRAIVSALERQSRYAARSGISTSFQGLLAPLLTPMLLAAAVDERSIGPQSSSKISPTRTPAMTMDLMSRETHRQYGRVPLALNGRPIEEDQCIFADGKFVLKTGSGFSFFYVPSEGILVDRSNDVDPNSGSTAVFMLPSLASRSLSDPRLCDRR